MNWLQNLPIFFFFNCLARWKWSLSDVVSVWWWFMWILCICPSLRFDDVRSSIRPLGSCFEWKRIKKHLSRQISVSNAHQLTVMSARTIKRQFDCDRCEIGHFQSKIFVLLRSNRKSAPHNQCRTNDDFGIDVFILYNQKFSVPFCLHIYLKVNFLFRSTMKRTEQQMRHELGGSTWSMKRTTKTNKPISLLQIHFNQYRLRCARNARNQGLITGIRTHYDFSSDFFF